MARKGNSSGEGACKNAVVSAGLQPDSMGSSGASVASQNWSLFKANGLVFCAPVVFDHGLGVAGYNLVEMGRDIRLVINSSL